MVNLAIIELNTLKSSKKKNVSHNSLKPNPYIEGTTRFIPSIGSNSFKTEVNNVTENVKLGQYCLKNKYTLIYIKCLRTRKVKLLYLTMVVNCIINHHLIFPY